MNFARWPRSNIGAPKGARSSPDDHDEHDDDDGAWRTLRRFEPPEIGAAARGRLFRSSAWGIRAIISLMGARPPSSQIRDATTSAAATTVTARPPPANHAGRLGGGDSARLVKAADRSGGSKLENPPIPIPSEPAGPKLKLRLPPRPPLEPPVGRRSARRPASPLARWPPAKTIGWPSAPVGRWQTGGGLAVAKGKQMRLHAGAHQARRRSEGDPSRLLSGGPAACVLVINLSASDWPCVFARK